MLVWQRERRSGRSTISTTTIQPSTTDNVNITTRGRYTSSHSSISVSAFRLGGMRNRRGLEQQQQQQQHAGQQQQVHPQPTMHAIQQQQQHIPVRQEQLQKQRSFEKPVNKRMEVDQLWPHETQSERGWVVLINSFKSGDQLLLARVFKSKHLKGRSVYV